MQFNGVNNKECQCCLESAAFHTRACARSHVLFNRSVLLALSGISVFISVAVHGTSSSRLPPHFPPSFHCSRSVTGACLPYCVGAHGWLARICQTWEQSPSRSWPPIVEAPGYRRHPTSILRCSC